MLPPPRMRCGVVPKVASRAAMAAWATGWSADTTVGRPDPRFSTRTSTPAVAILELGDDPGEGVRRVLDDSAEPARVDVERAAPDIDLGVEQASQAEREGRLVALEEGGVRDDHGITGDAIAVRREPFRQI